VAEFAQGIRFGLPNSLACYPELVAHLFEGSAMAVFKAKAHLQHAALTAGQAVKYVFHLLAQQLVGGRC
jgi:hypothetical protein